MKINPINLSKKSVFTQLFQKSKEQYWLPQSVDLSKDATQWPSLEDGTKKAVLSMLSYAILLDSYQVTNIAEFCSSVVDPQLKALLSYHGMMEAIHSESYSYFAETVCTAKEKANLYAIDQEGEARLKILDDITTEYGPVAANYWLEAVAFQGLFRLADVLRGQNKMPGLSSLIQLISRDEDIHQATFAAMMTPADKQWVYEALMKYSPIEGQLIAELTGIEGFKSYYTFVAAHYLKGLGFKTTAIKAAHKAGSPFAHLWDLGDSSKKKLKGNFFTSSLVYDNELPDLDWEVNNWFGAEPPTGTKNVIQVTPKSSACGI